MVSLIQSPRAQPRLESASTTRNAPVHLMLDHCAFFSPMAPGLTRRRMKVHGQPNPSARPLNSSLLTVALPRYDLSGAPDQNLPVTCQPNASPLTRPSTDPHTAPSGPCTSPLTFAPLC